jgi:hypothetical protein
MIHQTMRSPQLDENLHASINQTGLFYWRNFALKAKSNFFCFENEVNFGGFQSPEVRELFFEIFSIFVPLMGG